MLWSIGLGLKPRAIASNFCNWLYKPYHDKLAFKALLYEFALQAT